MREEELTRLLRHVHAELEDAERVTEQQRALLRELDEDIHRTLGDEQEGESGLVDRLNDAVEDFEQSHPTVAFALRRVIDALARMGI